MAISDGEVHIPSYVSDFARAHKVDLSGVKIGTDGRNTMNLYDVAEHLRAKKDPDWDLIVSAMTADNKHFDQLLSAVRSPSVDGTRPRGGTVTKYDVSRAPVDAMARNPLVDQVRAAARAQGAPSPSGTSPTVFASGDLPAFTVSGIPPQALLEVPWAARHAMAAAPTAAEAYAIRNECAVTDATRTAQMLYGDHPGNQDYAHRVEQWRASSLTDEQLRYDGSASAAAEAARRADAATEEFNHYLSANGEPPPMSAEDEAVLDGLASGRAPISNGRTPGQ